jgi:hypothetical protein
MTRWGLGVAVEVVNPPAYSVTASEHRAPFGRV